MTKGYISPQLQCRTSPTHGRCLFAIAPIAAGDLCVVWGGDVLSGDEVLALPEDHKAHVVQVDVDHFLYSSPPWPDADYVNHACDPNLVLKGQVSLHARRAIRVGEELSLDYATADSHPYEAFACNCGAATCRGRLTPDDWKRPELWARYGQAFSPYLLERIAVLKARR